MLTTILLTLFAYLAPVLMLHDQVALLTVSPSTALVQPGPSNGVDGPSLFLGPLGNVEIIHASCATTHCRLRLLLEAEQRWSNQLYITNDIARIRYVHLLLPISPSQRTPVRSFRAAWQCTESPTFRAHFDHTSVHGVGNIMLHHFLLHVHLDLLPTQDG